MSKYLLDPDRDHLRRICTPIVERAARMMAAEYHREVTDVPGEWEQLTDQWQAHWTQVAWQAVTGSIARSNWPSLQADH